MSETGSAELQEHRFSFAGNASDYFGIWIVNLFLSILTLGIYTAWAKVRRLRYFYGNTWLDGHNFEYHAKPKQILIGRIIVVAYLIFVNVIANIYPFLSLALLLPYLVLLPWVINKALAFNARMTSYRNVRLNFEGSYLRSLWIFIVLPILPMFLGGVILGAGVGVDASAWQEGQIEKNLPLIGFAGAVFFLSYLVLVPFISRATSNYIGSNLSFGTSKFNTDAPLKVLFINYGQAILIGVAGLIIFGLVAYLSVGGNIVPGSEVSQAGLVALQIVGFLFYISLFAIYFFYQAGVRNIAYNATQLEGGHEMKSTLSRFRYVWIILSNFVLTVMSMGLMRPWAAVRTWRYKAVNSAVMAAGPLDQFIDEQGELGNVAAAEYLDIDGIDFGL